MALFQSWKFRRTVHATLVGMHREGFSGTPDEIADECFKRLASPANPELAHELEASLGTPAVGPGGAFLEALMAMFTKMVESSMLMTIIKLLFGI